jgi:hypothetical protein
MNIVELREKAKSLPIIPVTAYNYWEYQRISLREHLLHDDPNNFTRWPPVAQTMFSAAPAQVHLCQLSKILSSLNWLKLTNAIKEIPLGNPEPYHLYPDSSKNMIKMAYDILTLGEMSGKPINKFEYILEFGGGFGALAGLIRRLGYAGKYILYDLPEFSLLQEFYLAGYPNIEFLTQKERASAAELFISIHAISEVPPELREYFLGLDHKYIFLSYGATFENVIDNYDWFERELSQKKDNYVWTLRKDTCNPDSRYLLGVRK